MEPNATTFRPIANPYIVGNPIRDRLMFFGREDDFSYIQNKFSGGKEGGLIVLCGARRSGKTSILFQMQAGRLGETFIPVLIDMQSMAVRNDKDFLGKLDAAIVAAGFHPKLAEIYASVAAAHDNPFAVSEQFVARLADECPGRNLVLMFDEYELIETHIDAGVITTQILNLLASLVEHRNVFIVFTGSDTLDDRSRHYWDVFLSKALHRRISFLSRRDTLRLIFEPVTGEVTYAEGVPERIAALTAGQPFYTQVVCQTLVDHLNEAQKREVAGPDLDKVVGEVIENPLPQMIFNWNALTHLERLALAIIAEISKIDPKPVAPNAIREYAQREKIGYAIHPAELNKALESLFHGDLLSKAADGSGYSFRMDLWRLWITRMHSVWQVIDEIEKEGGTKPGDGLVRKRGGGRRRSARKKWAAIVTGLVVVTALCIAFDRAIFHSGEERPGGGPGLLAGGGPLGGMLGGSATTDSAMLRVTSEPAGADVYFAGSPIGRTPLERRVAARAGVVTVVQPGYKDGVDTVDLAASDSARVHVPLVERVGAVRVTSTPPGAEIRVDGASAGKTPATLPALSVARLHDVTLELAGFAPRTFAGVRAVEDSTVALAHAFSRETFALRISSEPAGAAVFLDGQNVGPTPQIVAQVASGSHTLRLVKEGFAEAVRTIEVPSPDLSVTLEPLTPGVIVISVRPYAEVFVDGKPAGDHTITFLSVTRPPGEYTIELRHPEFAPKQRTVQLAPGDTVRVIHSFLAGGDG